MFFICIFSLIVIYYKYNKRVEKYINFLFFKSFSSSVHSCFYVPYCHFIFLPENK